MKKTNYILIVLLLFLVSCYPYHKETNKNGISTREGGRANFLMSIMPNGSYAADGKYVTRIDLVYLHDTISKRCFKSYELKKLKKVFSQDALFHNRRIIYSIRAYNKNVDLRECVGLFYVRANYNFDGYFKIFPLIKLNDTILVNGAAGMNIDSNTQKYIETNLLEVYDTIETKKRIDIFMRGRFNEHINKGIPVSGYDKP